MKPGPGDVLGHFMPSGTLRLGESSIDSIINFSPHSLNVLGDS